MGGSKSKPPTIEPETIEFIINRLGGNYDKRDILSWMNKFIVNHPDGHINKDNFRKIMQKCLLSNEKIKILKQHMFRLFDVDQNGYIDVQEVLLMLIMLPSKTCNVYSSADGKLDYRQQCHAGSCSVQEYLEQMFRIFDANNDGIITKKEMKRIVKDLFSLLNTEGSFTEETPVRSKVSRLGSTAFSELDEDQDGRITTEEFVNHITNSDICSALVVALNSGIPTQIWESIPKSGE